MKSEQAAQEGPLPGVLYVLYQVINIGRIRLKEFLLHLQENVPSLDHGAARPDTARREKQHNEEEQSSDRPVKKQSSLQGGDYKRREHHGSKEDHKALLADHSGDPSGSTVRPLSCRHVP